MLLCSALYRQLQSQRQGKLLTNLKFTLKELHFVYASSFIYSFTLFTYVGMAFYKPMIGCYKTHIKHSTQIKKYAYIVLPAILRMQ